MCQRGCPGGARHSGTWSGLGLVHDDLRAFLPAWQEMELASPSPEEPVAQIEADVPTEPLALQADVTHLDLELKAYERPLAVTPFGTPEVVPDWQETHAMQAFLGDHCLGQWIRTDLGVRTFQGVGRNGPTREQMARRITKDLHTRDILEDLQCDSQSQVPLHRHCLPDCGPTMSHSRDIQTIFVYRLFPHFPCSTVPERGLQPSRFPSGGGGGSASFSKFSSMFQDTSVRSTLGSRTLSIMRQFVADVEKDCEEASSVDIPELNVKGSHRVKKTRLARRHPTLNQEANKALQKLIEDFEDQLHYQSEVSEIDASDDEEVKESPLEAIIDATAPVMSEENNEVSTMPREPQLYLCDDWIQPIATMRKPRELTAREKAQANVAKNCLIVTLMSLELGYGSILERYQQEGESLAQRYEQPRSESRPTLSSVLLTDEEEFLTRRDEHLESDVSSQAAVAAMPPPTRLSLLNHELAVHSVGSQRMKEAVNNANLKMYHVMSVKQTLREDLAEHAYQFSCRAAEWSRSDFSSVPMRFEPLELHVVDALGQQEVPDYFQQPAKAITEDVSVMKGPDALEWIQAVLDEIESFKRQAVGPYLRLLGPYLRLLGPYLRLLVIWG